LYQGSILCGYGDNEIGRTGISGGCEGNAIITRFDMSNARALVVACQRLPHLPQHTSFHTHAKAVATLATSFGPIECYSVHLDPHDTGVRGRIAQYLEIMKDASAMPRPLFTATHQYAHSSIASLIN
jgi:endonuclease/exonuclease/phosphatase family metal-dependent hydrolase